MFQLKSFEEIFDRCIFCQGDLDPSYYISDIYNCRNLVCNNDFYVLKNHYSDVKEIHFKFEKVDILYSFKTNKLNIRNCINHKIIFTVSISNIDWSNPVQLIKKINKLLCFT